jgi:Acyl-CoA dehydrogenases
MSSLSAEMRAMLDDSVDKFLRDHYSFDARRRWVESTPGYSPAHWQQFAELGWLGIPFAEDDGGLGGTIADTLGLMRRFGRALVVEPYLGVVGLAGQAIAQSGNADLKASLLPGLIAGDILPVLAWEEPHSRGNPAYVETRAQATAEGWRIDGEKVTVLNAPQATHLVVSTRSGGRVAKEAGIELFVVAVDTPGVVIEGFSNVDGHRAGRVRFDGVAVTSEQGLNNDGEGGALLRGAIDVGCLMLAAEALGAMETLLDKTIVYTQTRKQFGIPIAGFQVLQHRMVDMYIAFTNAENLFELTVAEHGNGEPVPAPAAALLKAGISQSARHIGQQAIQLHGGIGMIDELDVGHYFKRLTAPSLLFGGADIHLKRYWQTRLI